MEEVHHDEVQEVELGGGEVVLKISIDPWQLQIERRRRRGGERMMQEVGEEEVIRTVLPER